jgi:hypothetical protein
MYLRVIGNSSFGFSISGKIERTKRVRKSLKKQPMKYMFSNAEILIRNCSFPSIFKECSVGFAPDYFLLRVAL